MTRNVEGRSADDGDTDSDLEIWTAIRYLDQDVETRKSDRVTAAWIVFLLLIFMLFYFVSH
jgi:hypothetical protein